MLTLYNLPLYLPENANSLLFHEHVHYWQSVSCPLLQLQFLLTLDKLRTEVSRAGGTPRFICGQSFENDLYPSELLGDSLEGIAAHFNAVTITQDMIESVNPISYPQLTKMLFLKMPHGTRKGLFAGMGAVLGFASSDKVAVSF